MTAAGFLFNVIMSGVVVGVLGVLICIGVEVIGKVSGDSLYSGYILHSVVVGYY